MYNDQSITFPTLLYLFFDFFCSCLLHSIMFIIVSSLSTYSLHLLFSCVLSIFYIISGMLVSYCISTLVSSSSSSSCRAASTDIPDPLSTLFPSFIASGRSSGLHPVSSHSCYMYVLAGRLALVRPYVGVHRSTSVMNSSCVPGSSDLDSFRDGWQVAV